MSSSLPSAEVAADFRDALQDLKMNSRPEISNLTVIAKENTEFAQAISRELEQHIREARPEYKLPALYVLDSIVKNVGTPYTVYLGRNLFSTFMGAYSLVDSGTRRAMDALMKTWKQPIPESVDPRPVFPVEATRDIENALIKFRTVTLQQQQQSRPQPQQRLSQAQQQHFNQQQWRNTPTPPQAGFQRPPNGVHQHQPPVAQAPIVPSPLRQYASLSTGGPILPYARPSSQSMAPQSITPLPDLAKVRQDLDQLIVSVTIELTVNKSENSKTLLNTLLSLQKILQSKDGVPADALQVIDEQVARIKADFKPAVQPPPQPIPPLIQFPQQPPLPPQPAQLAALLSSFTPQNGAHIPPPLFPPSFTPVPLPPTPQPSPQTDQVAALLQALAPRPTPPPLSQPLYSAPPLPAAPPSKDLFASLRAAGLLPGGPAPVTTNSQLVTPQPPLLPASLAALTAPRLKMDTASLKIPRPHLINRLYDEKPDQCRQCGLRFPATEQGKETKAKHMDWHYYVNTRISESSNVIVNRSWYIDTHEWVKYREVDPLNPDAHMLDDGDGSNGSTPSRKKRKKEYVVSVPTDVSQANAVCAICQDKFDDVWHDELQTPVWLNAVQRGEKYYHKTCHDEVYASQGGSGSGGAMTGLFGSNWKSGGSARSTPTPESVLGKRKFENEV